jgi:hypothetical protein
LGLEYPYDIHWESFVASRLDMHTALNAIDENWDQLTSHRMDTTTHSKAPNTHVRLSLDHSPVELILVPERDLLLQLFQPVFFGLVVSCTVYIVLVLLEQAELLAMERLGPFLVVSPVKRVWGVPERGSVSGSGSLDMQDSAWYTHFEAMILPC